MELSNRSWRKDVTVWNKTTIGLSSDLKDAFQRIKRHFDFNVEFDAYKFCLSIAVIRGLEKPKNLNSSSRDTKWNTGSLDKDNAVISLLSALYPGIDDYTSVAENTAEAGIEWIDETLTLHYDDEISLDELIKMAKAE